VKETAKLGKSDLIICMNFNDRPYGNLWTFCI